MDNLNYIISHPGATLTTAIALLILYGITSRAPKGKRTEFLMLGLVLDVALLAILGWLAR